LYIKEIIFILTKTKTFCLLLLFSVCLKKLFEHETEGAATFFIAFHLENDATIFTSNVPCSQRHQYRFVFFVNYCLLEVLTLLIASTIITFDDVPSRGRNVYERFETDAVYSLLQADVLSPRVPMVSWLHAITEGSTTRRWLETRWKHLRDDIPQSEEVRCSAQMSPESWSCERASAVWEYNAI
jgi:hypothetical protein